MYSYFVTNDIGAEGVVMVGAIRQTSHFAINAKAFGKRMRTPHSIVVVVAMVGIISLLVILFIFALNMKAQYSRQSSTQIHYQSSTTSQAPSVPDTNVPKVSSAASASESQQSTTDKTSTAPKMHTDVSVNGKSVPLPADGNGSVHKVITSNRGGKTSVDITVKTKSSSSNSSNLDLNVESNQMLTYNSE